MNNNTKKLKKKLLLLICFTVIIAITFLCIKIITKINSENSKYIIAGKDISKNDLTETMNKFEWEKDVSSSIGSISIENNGKEVKMTGNQTNPGKNAIYIIPESHQEQTFGFTYSVDYGDSFISAGVLLRVKKEGNQLKGYMISFNNPSEEWYDQSGSKLGAIWKFTYTLGNNSNNNIQKTLVKALNIPVSGSMTVKSNSEQILITGTSINETITLSPNDEIGDGFGFFSTHYSHDCDQIGHFSLTNFSLTTVDIIPHNLYVDPNGGTWKNSTEVSTIVGKYKDEIDIPVPTRPGYTFVTWTKTGESGTMSSLTDDAIYTFGEDELTDDVLTAQWIKIDVTKKSDVINGDVVNGQEITYTLTIKNSGTVDGTVIIKDSIPNGTTFVENSIKVNEADSSYTKQDLETGINFPIGKGKTATISFKARVNKLTNGDSINNTAKFQDITVSPDSEEKSTNNIELRFVEPLISQTKSISTENNKDYVVNGELVTYSINISNDGYLGKDVILRDIIPAGTTFVNGSIKLNGATYKKDDGSLATDTDLKNGIKLNIPAETKNNILSFDVTVNDLDDETIINNTATVDENQTNNVSIKYIEPIISSEKTAKTEFGNYYVVNGEKITYNIIVQNEGSLEKEVIIKDIIPEGTTLVEGSIRENDEAYQTESGLPLNKDDLENGISILVPHKTKNDEDEIPGKTLLSFDVIVNDIDDEDIIKNIATVDDMQTNEVNLRYVEPIISQTKELQTEFGKDYVVNGEKIKYTITIKNNGGIDKDIILKDKIPEGTSLVEGSIKINDNLALNNDGIALGTEDLENGIEINIPQKIKISDKSPDDDILIVAIGAESNTNKNYEPSVTTVSFEVIVKDLDDEFIIKNVATIDDIQTNEVSIKYIEPIISSEKTVQTQFEKPYVVNGEKVTYYITVQNQGSLEKEVIVKDIIPEGTTFVEESIKENGDNLINDADEPLNADDLANGIKLLVPNKKSDEIPGETILSFDVIINDLEDETIITNTATVDDIQTNQVALTYAEPIISQEKDALTQYNKDYVSAGETITYNIIVENAGSLEKNVIIKDLIPNGTTFVTDSITLNNEPLINEEGNLYNEKDLENGIEILVPAKTNQEEEIITGKSVLSFKVIVNNLSNDVDSFEITNIASVDGENTNEIKHIVLPFNMKIDKQIKDFNLNSQSKTSNDKKMMKIEIHAKEINTAIAKVSYDIIVTNTGKIAGTATVQDIIPVGFELDESNPSYWTNTENNIIETTTETINPGESQALQVVLKWKNAQNNFGEKINKAEIIRTTNDSNAVETSKEDNSSEASIIMSIRTGEVKNSTWIITILSSITVLLVGIILIKKFVLG